MILRTWVFAVCKCEFKQLKQQVFITFALSSKLHLDLHNSFLDILSVKKKIKVFREALFCNSKTFCWLWKGNLLSDKTSRQSSSLPHLLKWGLNAILLWVWHVPSSAFLPLALPAGASVQMGVGGGEGAGHEERWRIVWKLLGKVKEEEGWRMVVCQMRVGWSYSMTMQWGRCWE